MKILYALIKKEFFQIIRDFSSILIAFILPFILLLIYRYAINLDSLKINFGMKIDDNIQSLYPLFSSFSNNNYTNVTFYNNDESLINDLVNTKIRGAIIIENDFLKNLKKGYGAKVQVISDGTETNLSNYTYIYASSIINNWYLNYINKNNIKHNKINLVPTVWFNEKLDSHYFILPGSLAITMTLIGMLLTALVVSREWEKGTYESLITTHMTKLQFILSKYIPYFILGMLSMSFNIFLCIFLFKLPLRGNFFIILLVSAMFLYACLGFGLIISTYYKNQFLASQTVLIVGFMPSLMLSGLIYPISSMPIVLQYVTKIIPAKYFVSFIQSEFMVGSVFSIILPNLLFLFSLGTIFFSIVFHLTKMRLE